MLGAVIVGKMERESKGKISYDHTIEIAASSQKLLAGGSRDRRLTLPELILSQK